MDTKNIIYKGFNIKKRLSSKKKLSNFWKQESDLNIISSFGYATFVKNRMKVFKHLQKKKIESRPQNFSH